MPHPHGTCSTCSGSNLELRANPLSGASQCMVCCLNSPIIGISDIKSALRTVLEPEAKRRLKAEGKGKTVIGGKRKKGDDVVPEKDSDKQPAKRRESGRLRKEVSYYVPPPIDDAEDGGQQEASDEPAGKKGEHAAREQDRQSSAKRGRGRPRKSVDSSLIREDADAADATPKRGRGRPRKSMDSAVSAADTTTPKRRGRPRKSDTMPESS